MLPELQQVYWYSGVYLQPQHLQSTDLHHNFMLSRHRQLAQPWNVGIIQCDFNPEPLVDFSIKMTRLQAILPSGDYLEFPGNCVLQPRQFRDAWKHLEKPFTLWLALRRFDPGHANVGDTSNSRWVKTPEEGVMKDVYFNGPECSVARIIYNVQILSDEEKAVVVDCEFLPFLRLRYDNDRVIVDPDFCPPLVNINGCAMLKNLLAGLYAELASRMHKFEEYKRPKQSKHSDKGDITQLLAMRTLSRTLPLLNHFCRTPNMHSWPVFGLLTQLVGELSSFSEQCSFTGEWGGESMLLPYDHYNPAACFLSARRVLTSLLKNLTLQDNTWVHLVADEQNVFRGDLQSLPWQNTGSVLLLLRSDTLAAMAPAENPGFKVAPARAITRLIQHALPGVNATLLNPTPRGVPDSKDAFYFSLNSQDSLWQGIEQDKDIAFYWDGAPEDLQVQVIFMEDN
ncbi:type VI secretion system baseplate subunit TssK [Mangrovibacter phragmitis]|uniref:type VI secretion system baseplate subunit TssK n=1 Tax=Mangrovibacter phragmitis TaxID=1691903 RepID=UPI00336A1932